jgi:hypothetical protein
MALRMLMAFTSLPGFVTLVFRGMPTVWRGRHRLIFCWLVFMQAVHPGRHTLEEMARWTPATITAWRFGRLLKAAYWNVHLLVHWLAQDLLATLPNAMSKNAFLGIRARRLLCKFPLCSPHFHASWYPSCWNCVTSSSFRAASHLTIDSHSILPW